MSPHVAFTSALRALDCTDLAEFTESRTEDLMVRHFTLGAITAEEFHHYSAWLLKVSRQRKEAA